MLTILFAAILVGYIFIPLSKAQRYSSALVIVVLFNVLMYPSVSRNLKLQNQGAHTTGVLVEKDCATQNRQRIKYRFSAAGRELVGEGRPGVGNPSCEAFHPGDQVFVTYLPDAPEVNVPERAVDSWLKTGLVFSVLLVFLLAWMNKAQAEFKQRKRASLAGPDSGADAGTSAE
jgi:hypothetical protein